MLDCCQCSKADLGVNCRQRQVENAIDAFISNNFVWTRNLTNAIASRFLRTLVQIETAKNLDVQLTEGTTGFQIDVTYATSTNQSYIQCLFSLPVFGP